MIKTLFHGSDQIIEVPQYGQGAKTNDYGRGFYCTEEIELAKEYLHDNFLIDISEYDVIVGYRADDSYFSFAQDFVSNTISLKQLSEAMRLGRLGEQVVLKSQKAFERITYITSEHADKDEFFIKKSKRDKLARQEYRKNRTMQVDVEDIFILDIMREGMTRDDRRLR